MSYITFSKLLVIRKNFRMHNRKLHKILTSKHVREKFLDFFIHDNDHKFIKSSPIVPMCDSSIAFVNAGMNQFKDIFLGLHPPQYKRVANHQKCVRVGGKHNDLNEVGSDGYHHTFFEMLGNWSFGDYFKTEACQLAWELITKEYKLPPSRLYVTYFNGDSKLGLQPDIETKEIWQRLGLPENRILPFGVKDNFWEMGLMGPCGPSTEIHVDHLGFNNRASFVNKGLHDLTEIWNIVFIEYNRNSDGTIVSLPQKHVDTGMGFERLTAIVQGKVSNYDTDIFSYLLNAIHKNCSGIPKYGRKFGENDWNGLDSSYRTLADHTRMITACLADGMIPEQNQKFRRILRKSFLLSETVFKKNEGLLKELTNYVVENLGSVYPEMERNIHQIHQIIDYEEAVFKEIRKTSSKEWESIVADNPKLDSLDVIESPSLVTAYKEIKTLKEPEITSDFAFKLYDTHGLDEDMIEKLANILNLKYDGNLLRLELEKAKLRSKKVNAKRDSFINQLNKFPYTDDSFKYIYEKSDDFYSFPLLNVTVLGIIVNDKLCKNVKCDVLCSLILDRTNLYCQAGGQSTDKGEIKFSDNSFFEIIDTEMISGRILHSGYFKSCDNKKLQANVKGVLSVNSKRRLNSMRNHTSTHLLNAKLKQIKGATCQKSSKVTETHLTFDVAIFNRKLTVEETEQLETQILELIRKARPVVVSKINSQKLLDFDFITTIPGEVYPNDEIRIIEIEDDGFFVSREPCCGTHVLNTADIEDFCIISVKSLGRSTASIVAVTGNRATEARKNAMNLLNEISNVQKRLNKEKSRALETDLNNLRKKLKYNPLDENILPVYIKNECKELLDSINQQLKEQNRDKLKSFIEMEMQNVLQSNIKQSKSNKNYIIHYLRSSMILESVPLQRATKMCPDLPVLVISYADNVVKARCCVPQDLITDSFNAEKWLKESVVNVFKSRLLSSKNVQLECNMKEKRVNFEQWETMLNESLKKAEEYAKENL